MIKYGKECQTDSNCKSKICEMTYSDTGKPLGRRCVLQKVRYGKICSTNLDCPSNRCVKLFDDQGVFKEFRCVVMKNQEPILNTVLKKYALKRTRSSSNQNVLMIVDFSLSLSEVDWTSFFSLLTLPFFTSAPLENFARFITSCSLSTLVKWSAC